MKSTLDVKAFIFDCFGVLYGNAGQLFYETHVPDYQSHKQVLRDLDKQFDYGLITQEELVDQVAEMFSLDVSFVADNIQGVHKLNEELLGLAQSLRPQYKVGLLSNIGPHSMDQFFTGSERAEYFDASVLSGEVGMIKPDPEIYKIIADKLGVQPEDCVMIDDSIDNCYGADAAGMKWIHYQDTLQCQHEIAKFITITKDA